MAYSKISTDKHGVLRAKVQAYAKDPETGKNKLYSTTIYNKDDLSEAKFRKFVDKYEIKFEEDLRASLFMHQAKPINRVLTFDELTNEWKRHVLQHLSKNYYKRIEDTQNKFNIYLKSINLYSSPVSEITVRHIQLYLNSFGDNQLLTFF